MNFENIKVKIDKPYPEITNANDSPQVVAIIKNLANTRAGELRAVLQYVYQSVVADSVEEEIATIFEEIGIVEMMHLDMLMHTITEFGGIPEYNDSQRNFFNANVVNYTTKLSEMLDNNIQGESLAIENYKQAIMRVDNQSLKDLFARIIEDEEQHIRVFKKIRDSVRFLSI